MTTGFEHRCRQWIRGTQCHHFKLRDGNYCALHSIHQQELKQARKNDDASALRRAFA